jgi:hypothetical protein
MLQPVPFDILFWTAILYFFLKYINTLKPVWLISMGIGFGLGLLNKYMVVFLAFGILTALLFTRHRKLWVDKYMWIAAGLAFIIFIPNLIWQFNHGFPVIQHMQELKETQLVNVRRSNILFDQLLMFTFGSVIWITGIIWLAVGRKSEKFRIFSWIYLAVLAVFLILKGKSYYMAGLYPFMFAAGGVSWELTLKSKSWRIVLLGLVLLLYLPLVPAGIPFMKAPALAAYFAKIPPGMGSEALLRWEDGRMHALPQVYADMLGWDEIGNIVIQACDTIKDKSGIMIYGENYGQAGAIDHFGSPYGLPPASSFSDSYIMWIPDSIDSDMDLLFYINDERGEDIFPMFESVDSLGSITNTFAREYGTTVYLCRNPKPEFFEFFSNKVRDVRTHRFE